MANHLNQLRETIQKILEENTALPEERVTDAAATDASDVLDWTLFAEFAARALRYSGYKGDYHKILQTIKQQFEMEGWEFKNTNI